MKRLLSIFERALIRMLGLDYLTIKERLDAFDERLKVVERQSNRVERKVYRAAEQSPDVSALQAEIEVMLQNETPVPFVDSDPVPFNQEMMPW